MGRAPHVPKMIVWVLAVALFFGAGVIASYAYYWDVIAAEWAIWKQQLSIGGQWLWTVNAALCIPAYFTVARYAYSRDDVRLACILAAFSASACTWAPALARSSTGALASVRLTGVLSLGFAVIFLNVPENPAYWIATCVLVMQHVGFDLGWWAKDYSNRPVVVIVKPLLLLDG